MHPILVEIVGYFSAFLVLVSFSMRTMKALRGIAVIANVLSLIYALLSGTMPMVVLQVTLLPLNIFRLVEMKKILTLMKQASEDHWDFAPMIPYMQKNTFDRDDIIFKKGDHSDQFFIVKTGEIWLQELDVTLKAGDIIGEIGIFAADNLRGATAIAQNPSVLYSLTDETVRQLYYQNPEFGIFLTRLIINRLKEQNTLVEKEALPAA